MATAVCLDCSTAPTVVCCRSLRVCDTAMVAWATELLVVSCRSLMVRLTMEVAVVLASLMMRASSVELSIMVWPKANALVSIAFTALSAARSISTENWPPLVAMAVMRPLLLSSSRRASSVEFWRIALVISSALPTKLLVTSLLTPSRLRSTSAAFCLSIALVPLDSVIRVRSTSEEAARSASAVEPDSSISMRLASEVLTLRLPAMSAARACSRSAAVRLLTSMSPAIAPIRVARNSVAAVVRASMSWVAL